MSIFKIYKERLLYSFKETFIYIKKHIFVASFPLFVIPLLGWLFTWLFEGRKELMNLVRAFWYLNFLPSIIFIILLFLIKIIRSDLELKNNIINITNNYSYNIGSLLELLKDYDYKTKHQNRHFLNGIHNSFTYSYNELNKLRIKKFDDQELSNLLKIFLSYFEYWWNGLFNMGAYNIKPIFKNKNSFLKNEKKIKNIAKEINNLLKLYIDK